MKMSKWTKRRIRELRKALTSAKKIMALIESQGQNGVINSIAVYVGSDRMMRSIHVLSELENIDGCIQEIVVYIKDTEPIRMNQDVLVEFLRLLNKPKLEVIEKSSQTRVAQKGAEGKNVLLEGC